MIASDVLQSELFSEAIMPVKQACPQISFPSGWHGRVKSAVLHTISLAHFSIVHARGMAAGHIRNHVCLSAQNERLREECALLREEIRIKDARMAHIAPPSPTSLWTV